MLKLILIYLSLILYYADASKCVSTGIWSWKCENQRCVKVLTGSEERVELDTCKLTCGPDSMLFPKPSGYQSIGKTTLPFLPTNIRLGLVKCRNKNCSPMVTWLANNAFNDFTSQLEQMFARLRLKSNFRTTECSREANQRKVMVYIYLQSNTQKLTLQTDESYSVLITQTDRIIEATIRAETFFGARHGLETISQLTAYKESHNSMQIVSSVDIRKDKPAYPYRGIMLDTSRNYFSTESHNKMNTLHWHITDTHSFPIEIKSQPELIKYGAYSPRHIYTHSDIRKIVTHGLIHGVRILPEFDEPAHCGEGWQFGPSAGLGNLAVCVNREPWQKYCVEPPCGQLNPTNKNVYDVLGKIYKEYMELFDPDMFHAGGDEININCWNTTKEITDWLRKTYGGVQEKHFLDMWGMFLNNSTQRLYQAAHTKDLPVILWTSKMTSQKYLTKYLDPKKHIIQIWSGSKDHRFSSIIENGFKTIFSTYDTLYLDCGYGNWITEGNNWCSLYKDWKLLYQNDPVKILKSFNVTVTEKVRQSILGQESAMWSEQVDEASSEGKIWPRSAALAERLWTNPDHDWRQAEYRLIHHRERMIHRGIKADALQPLWCKQNAGHCYYDPKIKGEH